MASASRTTHKQAVAGFITLPDVSLLPLPDHAGNRARRVYAIVGEILAARWYVYPDAPIPLTRDYVAKWPDGKISAKTAERGVRDLVNEACALRNAIIAASADGGAAFDRSSRGQFFSTPTWWARPEVTAQVEREYRHRV